MKNWIDIGRKIHVGDVVLVSEDNVPRGQWQKARVEATHEGRDGLMRCVCHQAAIPVVLYKDYIITQIISFPNLLQDGT